MSLFASERTATERRGSFRSLSLSQYRQESGNVLVPLGLGRSSSWATAAARPSLQCSRCFPCPATPWWRPSPWSWDALWSRRWLWDGSRRSLCPFQNSCKFCLFLPALTYFIVVQTYFAYLLNVVVLIARLALRWVTPLLALSLLLMVVPLSLTCLAVALKIVIAGVEVAFAPCVMPTSMKRARGIQRYAEGAQLISASLLVVVVVTAF